MASRWNGFESEFFDHHQPLTLEALLVWVKLYGRNAAYENEGFRLVPTPTGLTESLLAAP